MAAVVAYRKSGLGLRRFAREHRIPPGRLHYWIYQKHRNSRPTPLAQGRISERPPVFQEVKLGVGSALVESWAAEVRLPGGISVRFSRTAGPEWIGEVIAALPRPC
jgi:hypothetical protein